MTVRERVLTNRLIQKIDNNVSYSRQIGLSYKITNVRAQKSNGKSVQKKEKRN